MGKSIRLKDKTGPGVAEIVLKDYKDIVGRRKPKMTPFTKKERI